MTHENNFFSPISSSEENTSLLLNRFLGYVKTYSTSDSTAADNGALPSTPQQTEFAKKLFEELKTLKLENVTLCDHSYVYAYCPGTGSLKDAEPTLLIAHMDTSDEVTGLNVKPRVFENYSGETITYPGFNFVLDAEADKYLKKAACNHETIICSDGTTLLGADDKAGVAAIVSTAEYFLNHPEIEHEPFEMLFSPDEETGHGMDKVPLEIIKSKRAYTVDGGDIGELESECFNAYSAKVTFTGKACHTGSAREGKMVNAITLLSHFLVSLPHTRTPETTDGFQDFIAPLEISGGIEEATASFLLRGFAMKDIEEQKEIIDTVSKATALSFGGTVTTEFKMQYLNMKEKILADKTGILQNLEAAYKACGVTIVDTPIRGGTDGSRLTEMGIPTPNIFTGGHNFHSRNEWASLNQMAKSTDILIRLLSAK